MTHNKYLTLATIALLSVASVSCSKDDDNNNSSSSEESVAYDSHAVDLGLPSGLKWSDQNLGANAPEDYGDYFAWGSINPLSSFASEAYNAEVEVEKIPGNFSGDIQFDAATYHLGGKWRTPTYG